MTEPALLPCPFCGGPAHVGEYFLGCFSEDCLAPRIALDWQLPHYSGPVREVEKSIERWNTRAPVRASERPAGCRAPTVPLHECDACIADAVEQFASFLPKPGE